MAHRRTLAFRPRIELLEARTVPTLFTVNSNLMNFTVDGQLTLLEAIQAANTNAPSGDATAGAAGLDTIQFAPGLNGQTITLIGNHLFITQDLTINGPGADLLTINGADSSRIFAIDDSTAASIPVQISGLTLTAGKVLSPFSGGAIANSESLFLSDVTMMGNSAGDQGGAISSSGTLTINNCSLTANTAANRGGGIYNTGVLTVANSAFIGNIANFGGGIENTGTSSINNCTLSGNIGSFGGGIDNSGTLSVANSTLAGNTATGWGGGVHNTGAVTIEFTTLSANTATGFIGGGIFNNGTMTVTSSTLAGNTATNFGGAIINVGDLNVMNCTIVGNTAGFNGGGIINGHIDFDIGTLTVTNSTITGNSADKGGGIFNDPFNTPTITSTLVVGNSAATSGDDLEGEFSLSHSLIRQMGGFTFTESAPGTNLLGLDPLLGPLAFNGGPTPTMALLPGSPALDRGSNPNALAEDHRGYGFERVVGAAADIGAFESRASDVRLVPHPLDRTKNVLVVVGTRRSDTIGLRRDDGDVEVTLNGDFHAFDALAVHRVVAFGMEGNDKITSALAIDTLLDGGRGLDTLTGGAGFDILIGGNGADVLLGGGGRDILIGGNGLDKLTGGAGDDLLIGGRTTYDQDHKSLALILVEWSSAGSYTQRRTNLSAGTGVPQLSAAQITDGFAGDVLTGDAGLELFFRNPGDTLPGKFAMEIAVNTP